MPGRCKTLGIWLMVVSLCAAMGLHWVLLQSVAWAGMLVDYSRSGTVATAVVHTFDGRHPCPLCQAINKGREDGKKPEFQIGQRIDMDCVGQGVSVIPPSTDFSWPRFAGKGSVMNREPGVPPPRAA